MCRGLSRSARKPGHPRAGGSGQRPRPHLPGDGEATVPGRACRVYSWVPAGAEPPQPRKALVRLGSPRSGQKPRAGGPRDLMAQGSGLAVSGHSLEARKVFPTPGPGSATSVASAGGVTLSLLHPVACLALAGGLRRALPRGVGSLHLQPPTPTVSLP